MNLFYIILDDILTFFYHTYNQYVIISSISQNSFSNKGKKILPILSMSFML